ncbi:MAG: hypothetical protein FJ077_10790 [Cyanobacteria bacterium K_DeepCast_35m_m2_023]|nr:hypothetical protein [Cyanobacteria bacterium K_DeepCast_35m_m2_023]
MSTKPTSRRTMAISRSTNTSRNSFWGTLAGYASELAPVAGPLLNAIGQTADAIDRAEQRNRCVEASEEAAEEWPQKSLKTTGENG